MLTQELGAIGAIPLDGGAGHHARGLRAPSSANPHHGVGELQGESARRKRARLDERQSSTLRCRARAGQHRCVRARCCCCCCCCWARWAWPDAGARCWLARGTHACATADRHGLEGRGLEDGGHLFLVKCPLRPHRWLLWPVPSRHGGDPCEDYDQDALVAQAHQARRRSAAGDAGVLLLLLIFSCGWGHL